MTVTPNWLQMGMGELGVTEVTGSKHNPRVIEYHSKTGLRASDDETPWCGSFVAWCFESVGIPYNKSLAARARAWLGDTNFKALKEPILGAVGVLPRGRKGSGQGHVFFFNGWVDSTRRQFFGLGGNQGGSSDEHDGRVTVQKFNTAEVLGWMWPVGVKLPAANQPLRKSGVIQGAATAGGGGLLVIADKVSEMTSDGTIDQVTGQIESGKQQISAGTWLGIALGVLIIAAAGLIVWSRIRGAQRDRELAGE